MNWLTGKKSRFDFVKRFHSDDLGKLILRLSIGGLMLLHGLHKLQHGVGPIEQGLTSKGLPAFIAYGVYLGEVVAPVLLLIGFWTRPAGLVVALTMIVAIAMVHSSDLFGRMPQGGSAIELPLLFLLGGVAIFFTGAGSWSLSRGKGPMD